MPAIESDCRVRDAQIPQPCFLRSNQFRAGEVIARAERDRQWRPSRETSCALRIELRGQNTGIQYDAVGIDIPASHPTRNGRYTL